MWHWRISGTAAAGNDVVQPGAGERPVPVRGGAGDAEQVGGLFQRQASEVAEPHQLRLARVCRRQLGQGLVQGQEFAASSPFLFFADHKPELAKLVKKGRREFLAQWRGLAVDCHLARGARGIGAGALGNHLCRASRNRRFKTGSDG